MSALPYLAPGHALNASDWDALAQKANDLLLAAYDGRCPFLWPPTGSAVPTNGVSGVFSKRVFFFVDDIDPAQPFYSIAQQAVSDYRDDFVFHDSPGNYKRKYVHSPFQAWVDAATLGTVDPRPVTNADYPVCRLAAMSNSAWETFKPTLWPLTPFTWHADKYTFLDYSLEAHKREIGGVKYYVWIDQPAILGRTNAAEHHHWWEQAEIVLGHNFGSSFTWPDEYDKYRLLRFHNLQPFDVEITLNHLDTEGAHAGSQVVTVPAMGSLCVRAVNIRPAVAWVPGYDYFHKPLPLDPWFALRDTACNLTDPRCPGHFLTAIANIIQPPSGGAAEWESLARFDPAKWWDTTPYYFGVPSAPNPPPRFAPPQGQWFGDGLDDDTPLGDLLVHRGKLLVVRDAGPFLVQRFPAQQVTLATPTQIVTLRKADNTIALGVDTFTVTRQGDNAAIPAGAGADTNWLLADLGDHFEVEFLTRAAGATPRLSVGDVLLLNFKHLTDDKKWLTDFRGFATFATDMARVGITVTDPDPDHPFQIKLESADNRELYDVSANLSLACFALPGKTLNPAISLPSIPFPYQVWKANPVSANIGGIFNVIWFTYTGWDGTNWYSIVHDDEPTVDCYSTAYELSVNWSYAADDLKLTDTVGDLHSRIAGADTGSMTVESDFLGTPFGPMIRVAQSGRLNFPFATPGGWTDFMSFTYGNGEIGPNGKWDLKLEDDGHWTFNTYYAAVLGAFPAGDVLGHMNLMTDWGSGRPFKTWPQFTYGQLFAHYPRVESAWANHRFTPKPDVIDGDTDNVHQREPLVKDYDENKTVSPTYPGFDENGLLPLSSNVLAGGINIKKSIALLRQWSPGETYDVWARLSAWIHFLQITYNTPDGPATDDFSPGSFEQAVYYDHAASCLLTGIPDAERDNIGKNVLPIEIEHYNTLASIVNSAKEKAYGKFRSWPQYSFFEVVVLAGLGRGIGTQNYRPINQWFSWSKDDLMPDDTTKVSDWLTTLGYGSAIRTKADFYGWSDTANNIKWFDGATLNEDFGGPWSPTTVAAKWFAYHNIYGPGVDDYRWMSIGDGQALCAELGMTFIMEELICPATLSIADADPSLMLAAGGNSGPSLGPTVATIMQWFNDDPAGGPQWCYTPENDRIRADVSPNDKSIRFVTATDFTTNAGIYDMNFGAASSRLYHGSDLGWGGDVVSQAQAEIANRWFIYRRHGSAPAKSVVWPRNYCAYERDWTSAATPNAVARTLLDNYLMSYVPRIAVDYLEPADATDDSNPPEVTDLTEDENPITTGYENGKLVIWKGLTPIP